MTRSLPKAFISWSSGKDSTFALHEVRRLELAEVVGAMTPVNEAHDRVSIHGVRTALLDSQVNALRLPCLKVLLPNVCTNEVYETRMAAAIQQIKAEGVSHVIFGDLFLEDVAPIGEAGSRTPV